MRNNIALDICQVSKTYVVDRAPVVALRNINFTVESGEFVTILGESGCGKSTLLRLIIGLGGDYEGDIVLDDRRVTAPGADRSIVFQEPLLLPWLTIEQNVALALDASGMPTALRKRIAREHLKRVELEGFEHAYPHQLSGGMAQRAAIARALVGRPKILVLDEPLGALDSRTRAYMQDELLRIWQREGITVVMVTHDIEEAVYLSTKVVVMEPRPGRVRGILPIEWPYPRDRRSPRLLRLKDRVLQILIDGQLEPAYTVNESAADPFSFPALYGG